MNFHRAVDAPYDRGLRDRAIMTVPSPEAPSDGYEVSRKNSTIAVRSNRDCGVIEPRLWLLHSGINAMIHGARFQLKTAGENFTIDARLSPDRGLIVATIKCDRGVF